MEMTQIMVTEGLRVRPSTELAAERLRERHSPFGEKDESDTAMHCMVASSVNTIVPF